MTMCFHELHSCQHFTAGYAEVYFWLRESSTRICYWFLNSILYLWQNCPDADPEKLRNSVTLSGVHHFWTISTFRGSVAIPRADIMWLKLPSRWGQSKNVSEDCRFLKILKKGMQHVIQQIVTKMETFENAFKSHLHWNFSSSSILLHMFGIRNQHFQPVMESIYRCVLEYISKICVSFYTN